MTKHAQPTTTAPKAPIKRYVLYGLLIAAALGVRYWFAGPKLPMPDLSGVSPQLETTINAAAAKIDEAPTSANAWGNFGMVLAAHHFTTEALAAYEKANELAPDDWRWPYLKAVALEHTDPAESLAALDESARLGQADDDLPALELATALIESGQPSEAERVLRPVIFDGELPNNPRGQLLLARALIRQDKFDESLALLPRLAKHEETRKSAHELLSHVHSRFGNQEAAANVRGIAETLPPDKPLANPLREKLARMRTSKEAYIAEVNQLRHRGRVEETEQVGQEGYAKFPELALFAQGKTALINGHPAEAEPAFRQALEIDPNWIDALIGLGDSLADQDKPDAAEVLFRKAVEIEPSNGAIHFRLGRCLLKQNKLKLAVTAFQKSVEYLPLSPDAHDSLAEALAKTGRDAEADEHRRHAKNLAAASSKNQSK